MHIQKVTRYVTPDGKEHPTEEKARSHQHGLFCDHLQQLMLVRTGGSRFELKAWQIAEIIHALAPDFDEAQEMAEKLHRLVGQDTEDES